MRVLRSGVGLACMVIIGATALVLFETALVYEAVRKRINKKR